jgi:hypothetical protein
MLYNANSVHAALHKYKCQTIYFKTTSIAK